MFVNFNVSSHIAFSGLGQLKHTYLINNDANLRYLLFITIFVPG
jgi:hypothetical protein